MYDCIIIDYNKDSRKIKNLPKPTHNNFKYSLALVLILPENIVNNLRALPLGHKRLDYTSTNEFLDSIHKYFFFEYDPNKKICLLEGQCDQYMPIILKASSLYFEPKTILWKSFNLHDKDNIEKYVEKGFHSPYITDRKPDKTKIEKSLALSRKNIEKDTNNIEHTLHKITDITSQKDTNICNINIRLTKSAIKFLKSTTISGKTRNPDGSKTQKEMSGELHVDHITKEDGKIIYVIDINRGSVRSGGEENVDVSATRYNFHSHPEEAYIRNSVQKGWPSVTDYLGYHQLGENTILHCVATIEGLYVISFTRYWGNNLKKIEQRFIKNNFRIKQTEKYTPIEYTEKINNIKYKGNPIFNVQFYPWDKAGDLINVYYPKSNVTCIPTQKIAHLHSYLHK